MSDPAAAEMSCCNRQMRQLSNADRPGHKDGLVQRVAVYQCETCGRVDARGDSCDPYWVSAKGRMFLELRREAFERGGLAAPPPAVAIFDSERSQVIFVPTTR